MIAWTPGTRLGPYELTARIGAGGMGEVWKARDTRLDRTVVIKRLKADHSERFMREARAIAALNHPHICQLFDVGPDYLVMECVDGETLKGPVPVGDALRLGGQIASALAAAHRKGIVHRDVKPANVLVNESGAKLLDFGLARIDVPTLSHATTVDHGLTGRKQSANARLRWTVRPRRPRRTGSARACSAPSAVLTSRRRRCAGPSSGIRSRSSGAGY